MEPLNEDNWDEYGDSDLSDPDQHDLYDNSFAESSSHYSNSDYTDEDDWSPPDLASLDRPRSKPVYHSILRRALLAGDDAEGRSALPQNVVDLILNFAEYWAISGARSVSACCGENLDARHVTVWLPSEARTCHKLIVKAVAHDQGWATSDDPASYTWAELATVRYCEQGDAEGFDAAEPIVETNHTSSQRLWFKKVKVTEYFDCSDRDSHLHVSSGLEQPPNDPRFSGYRPATQEDCQACLASAQDALAGHEVAMLAKGMKIDRMASLHGEEEVTPLTASDRPTHVLLVDKTQESSSKRHVAYANPRACWEWTAHSREFSREHEVVQKLQPGEGISLMIRSQYPGWTHYLGGASLQLQYMTFYVPMLPPPPIPASPRSPSAGAFSSSQGGGVSTDASSDRTRTPSANAWLHPAPLGRMLPRARRGGGLPRGLAT
ncbi:hypothetical protein CYMTET_9904 [Cymbomonas tetramitiformis]|uniref:Uncharacterized protein n=1 Tax=Cymbomonas tetramitiformis TaxID=36881 RepID=A0AAE0LED1_9CHLO|nr:hypothetical protein CYMTET_9904 [Cymbomonas tetramitiformis]